MYRVTALLMAMAIALAASISLMPARPAAAIPTSAYCLEPEEAQFLNLINQHRAQNGVPPLVASQTAGAAAKHHSLNMANQNFFEHAGQDGSDLTSRMREHGYTFNTFLGENIAAGDASASGTFNSWRNSPGHNANMLNPNYTVIGIGRAFNAASDYGYYWTTTFGGVFDSTACGTPASAPQPQPTTPSQPQPQPTTAPQPQPQPQPTSPPTANNRSIRGGGGSAPAPGVQPTPRPSDGGSRSIRR